MKRKKISRKVKGKKVKRLKAKRVKKRPLKVKTMKTKRKKNNSFNMHERVQIVCRRWKKIRSIQGGSTKEYTTVEKKGDGKPDNSVSSPFKFIETQFFIVNKHRKRVPFKLNRVK